MISDRRDNLFIEVGSGGRLWAPLKDPMTHSIMESA
jgi:glucan biosynthesis protein